MTMNFKTKTLLAAVLVGSLAGCGDKNQDAGATAAAARRAAVSGTPSTNASQQTQTSAGPKGNPDTPLEAYKPLTSGNQLMAHYFALVGVPDDVSNLAKSHDSEYQRIQGDFALRDRLVKYRAELVAAAAEAKSAPYVVFDLPEFASIGRGALGTYDFEKKAFQLQFFAKEAAYQSSRLSFAARDQQSTSSSNSSQDPGRGLSFDDNRYSNLYFSNWRDFEYLGIPDEAKARELDDKKNQYRISDRKGVLRIRVYAFINAPMQGSGPSIASDSAQAQIMKIQLLDLGGKVLAEK